MRKIRRILMMHFEEEGEGNGKGGSRDANCSFFAVFSTFFKLQILGILSKMPQNTFFFKDHFVYTSMETY